MFHTTPVVEARETETTIDVPLPVPPPRAFERGSPFGGPRVSGRDAVWRARRPWSRRPSSESESVTVNQSEPSMIREVTVGGVELAKSGEIKRIESRWRREGPGTVPYLSEVKGGHGVHGQEQVG